jgi:hypothetical protein
MFYITVSSQQGFTKSKYSIASWELILILSPLQSPLGVKLMPFILIFAVNLASVPMHCFFMDLVPSNLLMVMLTAFAVTELTDNPGLCLWNSVAF